MIWVKKRLFDAKGLLVMQRRIWEEAGEKQEIPPVGIDLTKKGTTWISSRSGD